jgi:transcriptional regulator with XRE-family HTH domain
MNMSAADIWSGHWQQFGEFIREQRRRAELSQRQLAKLVNLSDTYMSQLERGLHEPSIRVLCALAEGLGLGTEQLLLAAARLDAQNSSKSRTSPDGTADTRTESAIIADPRLNANQKQALLGVLHSFLVNADAGADAASEQATTDRS